MTDWRLSLAKSCVKALVPFKDEIRSMRARQSRKPVSPHHETVIDGAIGQVQALRQVGIDPAGKRALEIGSGWYPIMPMIYRLAGAEHVCLTDVQHLLHAPNIAATIAFVREHKARILDGLKLSEEAFDRALDVDCDADLPIVLDRLNFSYRMAGKGWAGTPPVDIIFSHTTLEHIAPDTLRDIFVEARDLLRPGGVMSHGVDHTDHRANDDPKLSRIDFLRYSDGMWRLLCVDPLDYTNRLRQSAYVQLFEDTGYELMLNEVGMNGDMETDARRLPLWGRFRDMDMKDLAAAWSHYIVGPI